jgi:ABC-type multidrug transport system fused ATPase/permease subunit
MLLGAVVSVVGGLIVAFTGSWKLTLVMLTFMPMLFIGGLLANKLLYNVGQLSEDNGGIASSGQVSFYENSKWRLNNLLDLIYHELNVLPKCSRTSLTGQEKIIFSLGAQPGDKNFLQTNGVFLC